MIKALTQKIALAFLLIISITACQFNSTYLNREEDKKDAEKVTNQLFDLIKSKKYEESYPLYSDKFWAVTTRQKIKSYDSITYAKLGNLDSINLDKWETHIVTGTNPSSEYMLTYNNHYKKYNAIEVFRLMKEDDGKIKIVAYNINSDGFMK